MTKIILGIIIAVLFGYLGLGIEKYYKTRLKIIDDYLNFIKFAERQTEFLKTGIGDLINTFDYRTNELKKILENVVIDSKDEPVHYVQEKNLKEIRTFVVELGKSDYVNKNVVIKDALEVGKRLYNEAEKEQKQKGELIRKLIIVAGIALVLFIL